MFLALLLIFVIYYYYYYWLYGLAFQQGESFCLRW
jgi:hypothetical protein